MERFETAGIQSVRNAIFLSSVDASHLLAGALAKRTLVTLPLFSDSPAGSLKPKTGIVEIGFLGNMTWWPNHRDCIGFFRAYFLTLALTSTSISSARRRNVTPVAWRV